MSFQGNHTVSHLQDVTYGTKPSSELWHGSIFFTAKQAKTVISCGRTHYLKGLHYARAQQGYIFCKRSMHLSGAFFGCFGAEFLVFSEKITKYCEYSEK